MALKFEVRDMASYEAPKPKRKRAPMAERESTVLKECWAWLREIGVFTWRNNTGSFALSDGGYLSFGFRGSADLLGLTPTGRFLAVECKSKRGRQSPEQKKFEDAIHQSHGLYFLVHSLAELKEQWASKNIFRS
jgi:hypothetical protein